MSQFAPSVDLKVGDRVRLVCGMLRGQSARISGVNDDGTYFLIGDWTQQTGFVLVNYGPVECNWLEKVQHRSH